MQSILEYCQTTYTVRGLTIPRVQQPLETHVGSVAPIGKVEIFKSERAGLWKVDINLDEPLPESATTMSSHTPSMETTLTDKEVDHLHEWMIFLALTGEVQPRNDQTLSLIKTTGAFDDRSPDFIRRYKFNNSDKHFWVVIELGTTRSKDIVPVQKSYEFKIAKYTQNLIDRSDDEPIYFFVMIVSPRHIVTNIRITQQQALGFWSHLHLAWKLQDKAFGLGHEIKRTEEEDEILMKIHASVAEAGRLELLPKKGDLPLITQELISFWKIHKDDHVDNDAAWKQQLQKIILQSKLDTVKEFDNDKVWKEHLKDVNEGEVLSDKLKEDLNLDSLMFQGKIVDGRYKSIKKNKAKCVVQLPYFMMFNHNKAYDPVPIQKHRNNYFDRFVSSLSEYFDGTNFPSNENSEAYTMKVAQGETTKQEDENVERRRKVRNTTTISLPEEDMIRLAEQGFQGKAYKEQDEVKQKRGEQQSWFDMNAKTSDIEQFVDKFLVEKLTDRKEKEVYSEKYGFFAFPRLNFDGLKELLEKML